MAFDKAKTLQDAQKYFQKGQFDKAAKEYQALAKADPQDVNIRAKLAGIYAKIGQMPQAMAAFQEAATIYAKKGFYNKAVAIYKQMLQADPTYVEGYLKLAETFQKMGLMVDAMSQYKIVVAHYDKEGQAHKALEILQKMVDLDPSNPATHVKLAELYYKQSMPAEGYKQLRAVLDDLLSKKRFEDALKVYDRLLHFDPENAVALKECYRLFMQLGKHDHALPLLQRYLRAARDDLEAVRDVAVVFGHMGNTKNQKVALKELAKRLQAAGRGADAKKAYQKVLQLDPSDPTALAALGASAPAADEEVVVAEGDAEPRIQETAAEEAGLVAEDDGAIALDETAEAAEIVIDETDGDADGAMGPLPGEEAGEGEISDKQAVEILVEADVYVKYGLKPKAIAHLKRLALARPDHSDGLTRLAALLIEEGDKKGATEVLLKAAKTNEGAGRSEPARALYEQVLLADPANAVAKQKLAAPPAAAKPAAGAHAQHISAGDIEDALAGADLGEVPPSEEPSGDFGIDVEIPAEASAGPEAPAEPAAPAEAPLAMDDEVSSVFSDAPEAPAASLEEEIAIDVETEAPAAPPPPPPAAAKPLAPPPPAAKPIATPPPPAAKPIAPPLPAAQPAPTNVISMAKAAPKATPAPAPYQAPPVDPHIEELDEAEFYLNQGIFEEARAIYEKILSQAPGHPAATTKLAELAKGEKKQAAEAVKAAPAKEEQVSFDDVFSAFKQGVDKSVAREDAATHYDLGIAYKEMGLLDDAIREFVTALGGVGARKADCYNMVGLLNMEKGDVQRAAEAFYLGLSQESASPQEKLGLRYELAVALEALKRPGEALTLYSEIQAIEAGFRGAGGKAAQLQAGGVQPTPVQAPGRPAAAVAAAAKRRVSFV